MDEVDSLIILELKESGCKLDEEVQNVKQLIAQRDGLLLAVMHCLHLIDANKKFPKTLNGMTHKVSVATEVANVIKGMGYKNEISYHSLLYANESDTRKFLLWLVELLGANRQGGGLSAGGTGTGGGNNMVQQLIEREFKQVQQETWKPPFLSTKRYIWVYKIATSALSTAYLPGPRSGKTKALEAYIRTNVPFITAQPPRQQVVPSVMEHNTAIVLAARERQLERNQIGLKKNPLEEKRKKKAGLLEGMMAILRDSLSSAKSNVSVLEQQKDAQTAGFGVSRFGHMVQFLSDAPTARSPITEDKRPSKESEQELEEKRRAELEKLEERYRKLQQEQDNLQKEIETFTSNLRLLEPNRQKEVNLYKTLEEDFKRARKIADYLDDAEGNIKKLEDLKTSSLKNLMELAKKWEDHRVPLVNQYRELKEKSLNATKSETEEKFEKIKEMRNMIQEIIEENQKKDEKLKHLLELYAQLPKESNRAYYTRRILEIVKNVKRQKVDIAKILLDTRIVKKEINSINDNLGRTFAVTDEMIFTDATKDNTAKQVYKQFVGLDKGFKLLIEQVEEIGTTETAILDFKAKIETIQLRTDTLNSDRLAEDLKQIKKENADLMQKIRS